MEIITGVATTTLLARWQVAFRLPCGDLGTDSSALSSQLAGCNEKKSMLVQIGLREDFVERGISGCLLCAGNLHRVGILCQTRQPSWLISLLGEKQTCIGEKKIDCDTAGCTQTRFDESTNEAKSLLVKIVGKHNSVVKGIPFISAHPKVKDYILGEQVVLRSCRMMSDSEANPITNISYISLQGAARALCVH